MRNREFYHTMTTETRWLPCRFVYKSINFLSNLSILLLFQGLLKKHEAFEVDLGVHRHKATEVGGLGEKLIAANNHHSPMIKTRIQQLQQRLDALAETARRRLQWLQDNSAYLQFMWKCDVVESWIGKRDSLDEIMYKSS